MALLDEVKKACRVKTNAFDSQYLGLIEAAKRDLGIAGVTLTYDFENDDLVKTAIITFCEMRAGVPDNYEQLKASYDEQKAQMSNATGYTKWSIKNV